MKLILILTAAVIGSISAQYSAFKDAGLEVRYRWQSPPSFHPALPSSYRSSAFLPSSSSFLQYKRSPYPPMPRPPRTGSSRLSWPVKRSLPAFRQSFGSRPEKRNPGHSSFFPQPNIAKINNIKDCMTVATLSEGDTEFWTYRSEGETETCGLYLVSPPDTVVEVRMETLDIPCSAGLLMVFDGWELNGNVFPGTEDHPHSLDHRSNMFCNGDAQPQVVVSSQNAALVSYSIPYPGQGFTIKATVVHNPDRCNILMSDLSGEFTLENKGQARNCSLTTLLFPANFALLSLDVGEPALAKRSSDNNVQTQCSEHGWSDYIEMGGSEELDSNHLQTSETVCGFKSKPIEKRLTVLCGSSTVRLVSSGMFTNKVTLFVKAASEEDLDFSRNMVLSCHAK